MLLRVNPKRNKKDTKTREIIMGVGIFFLLRPIFILKADS